MTASTQCATQYAVHAVTLQTTAVLLDDYVNANALALQLHVAQR
jgi:hypothetical protein